MAAAPARSRRQPLRAGLGALVGTTVEWYDFYIFATGASLIFGQIFFPPGDRFLATLGALGTFAVGFFARPLGAILFGSLGDRVGRRNVLVMTLLLMGVSTISIGFLPSYRQAGIAAPILLVLLRIAQGIAVGGEWGGAVLIASEHGTAAHKGFLASLPQMGSPAGMILSILVFRAISSLPSDALMNWGWRLPFIASALLMIVGLLIRHGVDETPEFEAARARASDTNPALGVVRRMPATLLLAAGANTLGISSVYFCSVFMLTYATQYLHLPRTMILDCVFIATLVQFCVSPIGAWLADRVGAVRVLLVTSLSTVATAYLLYALVNMGTMQAIVIGLCINVLFGATFYAVVSGFCASLFPADVRYSAISIAYQGCAAIAGGLTPLLGTLLAQRFQGNWVPLATAYAGAALISAACIGALAMRRRRAAG
ncbi:MFS transporter [Paraburkholderia sp. J12]|uniref:MFS transporter n=1 Tax=Paraburkholderia sp. J12 TaxID=2805432 RepID=UPI0039F60A23